MGQSGRWWLEWVWTGGAKWLLGSQPQVEQGPGAGRRWQQHGLGPPAVSTSRRTFPAWTPAGYFQGLVLDRAEQRPMDVATLAQALFFHLVGADAPFACPTPLRGP